MTQSLHQRLGSLVLPPNLDTIEEAETLTSLDPARRILADLFKTAINAELAEAWEEAIGNRPTGPISSEFVVADVLELEPNASHMRQRQSGFPLLAIYRSGTASYEVVTIGETKLRQPWTVDWILGPADIAQKFGLGDTAVAVAKVIALVLEDGGHPAYTPTDATRPIFGEGSSTGIDSIDVMRHVGPGVARFADEAESPAYYAITIELESLEFSGETGEAGESAGIFEGADYDIGIGGEPAGTLHGVFYANSDHPGT